MSRSPQWLLAGLILWCGCTVVHTSPTTVLTAVSDDHQLIAKVETVDEKYVLFLEETPVLSFDAVPTKLEFSPTNDALLVIVNGDLYRYDTAARQATRLYEGVMTAEFSPSGQNIHYTTDADI